MPSGKAFPEVSVLVAALIYRFLVTRFLLSGKNQN